MGKLKISDYEKLNYAIYENAVFKITSAIELYCLKTAYPVAFFLAVIAEEELAKLIMLPFAKELGEISNLATNRDGEYFNHTVKQRIFSSYGLQNRKYEQLEKIKQECLYVGVHDNKPKYSRISPQESYDEVKYAVWLTTDFCHKIFLKNDFSDDFKKTVLFLLNILRGCVKDRLPQLCEDILKEAEEQSKRIRKESEHAKERYLRELFSNPYELIKIFKAVYGRYYKNHIRAIKKMPFNKMVKYLGKTIKDV